MKQYLDNNNVAMNQSKNINHPETQARITDNIAALKAFKNGDETLLDKYTGWGGLRGAIFTRDIFCQLKFDCGLSDAEIASIKQTTSSGYFTPVEIVRQMWALCERHLPDVPHQILDPACGTNRFFANMPKSWKEQSALIGVELETLSAAMAQARVHQSNVHCLGFEDFHAGAEFDIIVGNPPYGKQTIDDKHQPDLMQYCIHHAFALKAFRLLVEGGYLCLLLPSWFLDNTSQHVREVIANEGGELVEAVRLPDNLFQNATVTVDCVLIKKCAPGTNDRRWVDVGRVTLDGRRERINRYFLDNPKRVLGKLASVRMYDRHGLTCRYTRDPIDLWQQLGGRGVAQAMTTALGIAPVGTSRLDALIAQISQEITTRQEKYRQLMALKIQQQTLTASLNALQG